jgi:hypothetical protein
MRDALVTGTTDPGVLADLARRQMRKKIPQLRESGDPPVPLPESAAEPPVPLGRR